jgi:hypothetical protein
LIWGLIHLEKIKVTHFSQLTLYQNCKVTWQDTFGGTSAGLKLPPYTAQQRHKINVELHCPCGIQTHDSNVQPLEDDHATDIAASDWDYCFYKIIVNCKHTGGAIK